MTKEDMILEEVKYLRLVIDETRSDVAVLKSMHNNGNRSERISAGVAVVALLLSLFTIVITISGTLLCAEEKQKNETKYNMPNIPRDFGTVPKRGNGKIRRP